MDEAGNYLQQLRPQMGGTHTDELWDVKEETRKLVASGVVKDVEMVIFEWMEPENFYRIFLCSVYMLNYETHATWRIIPLSMWLITIVSKSPNLVFSLSKWPFHGL